MAFLLIALFSPLSVWAISADSCENYCVGVRGNGEAEPAHLAALSRMVEEYGMPKAMAGGSSATITMFLAESIHSNQKVENEQNPEKKRKLQALMFKTMPEFMIAMTKDSKLADGFGMVQAFSGGNSERIKRAAEAFKNAGGFSPEELKAAFGKYGGLVNSELLRLVMKNPKDMIFEAEKSVVNLGKFNAVTDDTLFFRAGLVDFKSVAVVVGYMADFYAGNTSTAISSRFGTFLDRCAERAFRREWGDVAEDCRSRFKAIAQDYLKAGKFQNKAVFERVGAHADSLPTTSIIQGEGVQKYFKMKQAFEAGKAKNIADFSLDFKSEMSFGYWGDAAKLEDLDKRLAKYRREGDLKASKFLGLGEASWFEVLATSPAEPGLANVQRIPTNTSREQVLEEMNKSYDKRWMGLRYRNDVLSSGGWSDLHPVAVLKNAPSCDRVLFLTRYGAHGDSKFGQQVFVRLTNTKEEIPFWDRIGEGGPSGWCEEKIRQAGGDPAKVADTPWNQMSNLCNPQSSFRRALDLADGSYCTNWDSEELGVFKGRVRALAKDAYEAPLFYHSDAGAPCQLNNPPKSPDPLAFPGCIPYSR